MTEPAVAEIIGDLEREFPAISSSGTAKDLRALIASHRVLVRLLTQARSAVAIIESRGGAPWIELLAEIDAALKTIGAE